VAGGFGLTCIPSDHPSDDTKSDFSCTLADANGQKHQDRPNLKLDLKIKLGDQFITYLMQAAGEASSFRFIISEADVDKVRITTAFIDPTEQNRLIAESSWQLPSVIPRLDPPLPSAPNICGSTTTDRTPTWSWQSGGSGSGVFRYIRTITGHCTAPINNIFVNNTYFEGGSTSFTPSEDLEVGKTHCLVVQEKDRIGRWGKQFTCPITVVEELPAAPTNLASVAGNGQVTLSWTSPSGTSAVARYNYRYKLNGQNWSEPIATESNVTSVLVSNLTNGLRYTFKVAAVNNSGAEGAYSSEIEVTPEAVTFTSLAEGWSDQMIENQSCDENPSQCAIKRQDIDLWWSYTLPAQVSSWDDANRECDILVHKGKDDWRLPRKDELVAARDNNISSNIVQPWQKEGSRNIIFNNWFWSSDLDATQEPTSYWAVRLQINAPQPGDGVESQQSTTQLGGISAMCVRP
jgi:hypothetical protein